MFRGSIVAIVTPMQPDGSIDKKSLFELIEWHIACKTDGLVIAGTTGESVTLTFAEQEDLIKSVIKQVNKRVPVIAGTGSNSTAHALELTLMAKNAGVDACLVVTPYYNKPTQKGMVEHYRFIAEKSRLPLLLYNVPGRTACDLLPESIDQLAKISHIIGIKEATGKIDRAIDILKRCPDFLVLSGDDATCLDLMLNGAKGVISVTANVAPKEMQSMCEAALSGNKVLAEQINNALMLLHKNLFVEPNPIPTKWALHKMGLIPPGIRLPLLPLDEKFHEEVRHAVRTSIQKNI